MLHRVMPQVLVSCETRLHLDEVCWWSFGLRFPLAHAARGASAWRWFRLFSGSALSLLAPGGSQGAAATSEFGQGRLYSVGIPRQLVSVKSNVLC